MYQCESRFRPYGHHARDLARYVHSGNETSGRLLVSFPSWKKGNRDISRFYAERPNRAGGDRATDHLMLSCIRAMMLREMGGNLAPVLQNA
jgi:hypothetical protein